MVGCVGTLWCPAEVWQDQLPQLGCRAFRSSYCRKTLQVKESCRRCPARSLPPPIPCSPSVCPSLCSRRCFLQLEGLLGLRTRTAQAALSSCGTCSENSLLSGEPEGDASGLCPHKILLCGLANHLVSAQAASLVLQRLLDTFIENGFFLHSIRNEFGTVLFETALSEQSASVRQGMPSKQRTCLFRTCLCAYILCPI